MSPNPPIAVLPAHDGQWAEAAATAIVAGGGVVVDSPGDAEALIWIAGGIDPETTARALTAELNQYPNLQWIQLPWAGVEQYAELGMFDHEHRWTCAKGIYSKPVAEHALTLTLACMRHLKQFGRADHWIGPAGLTLFDGNVTVFGGGGIAQELIRLLQPFDCHITVVRKRPDPMAGVQVVGWDERDATLTGADAVILALALTEETMHFFGQKQFEAMESHACLVNIARGRHVVTDELVTALATGQIGAAGLDVTDPEPLPEGHPLWSLDQCLITPHTANTIEMAIPLLTARITVNVRRWGAGEPLEGLVDPDLGY
jgi:phosphoglycerate dehydrogenase-like enzyme